MQKAVRLSGAEAKIGKKMAVLFAFTQVFLQHMLW